MKDYIQTASARGDDGAFNELALGLFRAQYENNAACRRFCDFRAFDPGAAKRWEEIPAIPTSAFKEFDLTCLAEGERTTVFHSSGTTGHRPSRHFHNKTTLEAYRNSLLAWFGPHFLGTGSVPPAPRRPAVLSLTPTVGDAPNSSLVFMFGTVMERMGAPGSCFVGSVDREGAWVLHQESIRRVARLLAGLGAPAILVGPAFSFVHLLDMLEDGDISFRLPDGSSVLETGGYKGRSREIEKPELHAMISRRTGVPAANIVCEYGMSELSSQAYDKVSGDSGARVFRFPPWARARVISPETGREVGEGEEGILRVFDLANIGSVAALQTEDLAVKRGDGFELLGRAALAEPRGCSLMPA